MEKFNFQYVKTNVLIMLIGISVLLLYAGNKYISSHWGVSFSIFAIATALFSIINQFLWNKKIFSWMYNVPDFTGRYEGTLKYEFKNEKCELITGTLEHIKIVKQNGSCVVIHSFTKKVDGTLSSASVSKVVSVIKEEDGNYSLVYNYLNDGDTAAGFPPHYGTEILKLLIEEDKTKHLVGRYYTERMPFATRGKIDLTYKNKNLTHEK